VAAAVVELWRFTQVSARQQSCYPQGSKGILKAAKLRRSVSEIQQSIGDFSQPLGAALAVSAGAGRVEPARLVKSGAAC
jgi:hypothetical protein